MANTLEVKINGKQFLSQPAKEASDALSGIQTTGEKVSQSLELGAKAVSLAYAGITTAIGAVSTAAIKVAGVTDEIDKMSQKLGLSREAYQEWDFIMSQSGATITSMQSSMKRIADRAVENSDAFSALGVVVSNSDGTFRTQEELFSDVVIALSDMEDVTARASIASDLFGRSATELAPLLNSGTGAIESMRVKAHELGLVLEDDVINAGVSLTDTIDQMKRSFTTITASAIGPLLPMLDQLGQSFMGVMQGQEGAGEAMATALSGTIETALNAIVDMAPEILKIGADVVFNLIEGITKSLPTIVKTAIDIVMSLIDSIIENLPLLIESAIDIILALANGLIDAIPQLTERIPQIIEAIINGLIKGIPRIISAVPQLVMGIADGLIKAIPVLVLAIPKMITSMINEMISMIPQFLEIGKQVVQGFTNGIKQFISSPVEALKTLGESAVNGFKNFFGIKSPSRLFMGFGENVSEGFAIGIKNSEDLVSDALKGLGITPNMSGTVTIKVNTEESQSGESTTPAVADTSFIDVLISGFSGMFSSIDPMVQSLGSVTAILDPFGTILGGIMEVLGPVIDEVLGPLVGILKVVGHMFGAILAPAIRILTPAIELISKAFVWLYNMVFVPVGNAIIMMFNGIGIMVAHLVNAISGAIKFITFGVINLGQVAVPSENAGLMSRIDTATLVGAGSSGSSYTGGGTGSSTSVQSVNITIHQHFDGNVIGEGGLEQVGAFMVDAIRAYAGVGGSVQVLIA
jgi:phage-related protein